MSDAWVGLRRVMRGLASAVAQHAQLPVELPSSTKALRPYLETDYNPFADVNANDKGAPAPVFSRQASPDDVDAIKAWYQRDPATRKFRLLAPSAYKRLDSRNPNLQRPLFEGTLRLLQTRRTAKTSLALPPNADGETTTTYPGSVLPPTIMKTVEVTHRPGSANQRLVERATDYFVKMMHRSGQGAAADGGSVNMIFYRIAQISVFDARAYRLFFDEEAARRDPICWSGARIRPSLSTCI